VVKIASILIPKENALYQIFMGLPLYVEKRLSEFDPIAWKEVITFIENEVKELENNL
jgi:hypothetical protein